MTDYYPPIQRAVQGLSPNTPDARRAMYDRARTALLKQLRGMTPPLAEEQITRERMLLEEAVRRVESEMEPDFEDPPADEPFLDVPAPSPIDPPLVRPPLDRAPREGARKPARAAPRPVTAQARAPATAPGRTSGRTPGPGRLVAAGVAVLLVLAAGGVAAWTAMRSDGARTALLVPDKAPAPARAPDVVTGKLLDRIAPQGEQQDQSGLGKPGPVQPGPSQPETVQPGNPQPSAVQPPQGRSQEGTRTVPTTVVTASDAQSLAPAPSSDAPQVAQRAVMFEEDASGAGQGQAATGAVTWRTESVAGDASGPLDLAVRGEIDVPERKLKALLTLRRNTDPALPATHTLQIQFTVPKDFPDGGISNVPGVLMKVAEAQRGAPLAGLSVKVTSGYFLIGLNNGPADTGRNEQLLKERDWIDIPILFDNGKRAILSLDKGVPGERAFADAFSAWGGGAQAQAGSTPAQEPADVPSQAGSNADPD